MTNNELVSKQDVKQFEDALINVFRNNMSSQLAKKLAGLLVLDYIHRLGSKPEISEYIDLIMPRLKKYVGYKVISEDDFSLAMVLFTVAITPEKDQDIDKSTQQEQLVDAALDATILEHFSDLSPEEMLAMKEILKELTKTKSLQEVMGLVAGNVSFFRDLAKVAKREKQQKKELRELLQHGMIQLMQKQKQIKSLKTGLRSLVSKVVMATSIVAVASIGLLAGGLMLPALAIPALAATTRVAGKVSEKISDKIIQSNKAIQIQVNEINGSKSLIMHQAKEKSVIMSQTRTPSKTRVQAVAQERSKANKKTQERSR